MERRFYTLVETAELLRISVSTVRRAVASGSMSASRVGSRGQLRISENTLQEYLGDSVRSARPVDQSVALTNAPETAVDGKPPATITVYAGDAPSGASWQVIHSDALVGLRSLPAASVNCIVTSPPYYWQRDYEIDGQLGHEASIDGYVTALTKIFDEARRVLAADGLLFLNLGDTYYSAKGKAHGSDKKHAARQVSRNVLRAVDGPGLGLPRKSLIGIPWRVALSLQSAGWTLRSDIVWQRPASVPEPTAKDRPWRSHEHVFMFAKQPRYWFDRNGLGAEGDVWTFKARPENPGSHFAPYPLELVDRCLRVGCKSGGVVLDPFVGSGTTMIAAVRRGMSAIGIDLKREYCDFASRRIVREGLTTEHGDKTQRPA